MRTGWLLLSWMLVCHAFAGDIKIHDKNETYDPFAVRDKKRQDHEWQEQQRLQQSLELIERLPVNCIMVPSPARHYRCGDRYYRPYPEPRRGREGAPQRYQRFYPSQQEQ